jgi:7,8-dihydropterin-6-yl-methyl-4-(beta-D-ribofuranosyl)aminobenzene 5'-phosphate synthase
MRFRITVLCENSVGKISGTLGEHGFAALIETGTGDSVLFDTGQGATLLHNARRMNRDLAAVPRVVLSHGHYDHTGGLLPLLKETGPKKVYGHPGIFSYRFRQKDNGELLDIGMPYSRAELESAGAEFDISKEFRQISPGIFLTGEVPRVSTYEEGDLELYTDIDIRSIDSVPDDQSLVLETEKGLVVVVGCCHSGIINTLDHIEDTMGRRDFYAIIGGTHLGFCGQNRLDQTVKELRRKNISKLAVSHCTGFQVSARLSREMPKQFQVAMVGYSQTLIFAK